MTRSEYNKNGKYCFRSNSHLLELFTNNSMKDGNERIT